MAEKRIARKVLPIIFGEITKEMHSNNPGFDYNGGIVWLILAL